MKKTNLKLWAIVLWLIIWQMAAVYFNKNILLPSPIQVFTRLIELMETSAFWIRVGKSFINIFGGFAVAFVIALVFAVIANRYKRLEELLAPLVALIKSVPVVSVIILALVWLNSQTLTLFVVFLIVFPTVYVNILEGLTAVDKKLLEMSRVFKVPYLSNIFGIYIPTLRPYIRAALSLGLGLCWKAGVTAEVIGQPDGTIGERLYSSKIYFETADLFAWTITIIMLSAICEKVIIYSVNHMPDGHTLFKRMRFPANNHNYKNDISAKSISKCFGNEQVLKDLSFEVPAGLNCIVAPSGSGKTTLLNIILGLDKEYTGNLSVEDREFSVVFQENRLLEHLDARGNLAFVLGEKYDERKVTDTLNRLNLEKVGEKRTKDYSGGMKRRLAVARALLVSSDVYIFDEPFSGLDEDNKSIVLSLITECAEKHPVILVTHDTGTIDLKRANFINIL